MGILNYIIFYRMIIEKIIHIVAVGFFATIAMTIFSYVLSYFTSNELEEPQLLNKLINNHPGNSYIMNKEHSVGWAIHLFIGILFVAVFEVLLTLQVLNSTLLTGVLFGLVAGCVGVAFWWSAFTLHPKPPHINRTLYYAQLVPAHIIFGITMVALYPYS